MDKAYNKRKILTIVLLFAGLILAIAAIIKSSIILDTIRETLRGDSSNDMIFESKKTFSDYSTYSGIENKILIIPILYIAGSVMTTLVLLISLVILFTKKDAEIINNVAFASVIELFLFSLIFVIVDLTQFEMSTAFGLFGLDATLVVIPLILNCSVIFISCNNSTLTAETITEKTITDQSTESKTNEESLMQEEITKLRHQLKLKKLEEEYLDLKKQLEPKSKTKKESE